ncbi:hypothetical protein AVEN_145354-1 [Araneus ventricosus]|uniref:SOCS box domain-containing protein n=1 Tax=Araneus ventricosus TaxID=182803 RepID=A0A4Y2GM47_ARAVE|nr:hypothetical protein AVEN_145354-1 [Araneus ventricosus]
MKFTDGHLFPLSMDVFEFVLYKTNQGKYNLWTLPQCEMINASIYFRLFKRTEALLQYRDGARFCNKLYDNLKRSVGRVGLFKRGPECPVEKRLITKERHFLILQIFDVFCRNPFGGLKALQMLWRSIPDPFITMDELTSVFTKQQNTRFIEKICNFIEEITGKEVAEERRCQPRKLKHNCRILIRRALSNNFQLSTGIAELNLPLSLAVFSGLNISVFY